MAKQMTARWPFAGLALLSAGLSACLPLAPYEKAPGYYGSRSDLGDGVPAFIVTGRTSRAEVTRILATPEVEAPDGQWSYYESNYLKAESGMWALVYGLGSLVGRFPLNDEMLLRRLFLRYDAADLVADVEFSTAQCTDIFDYTLSNPGAADLERCPILRRDVAMRAERQTARMRQALGPEEEPVRWFERAVWQLRKRAIVFGHRSSGLWCGTAAASVHSGLLGVSARSVVFLPRDSVPRGLPAAPSRIARDDIASVQIIDGLLQKHVGVEIKLTDGKVVLLSLCGQTREGQEQDKPGIEAVLALLTGPKQ